MRRLIVAALLLLVPTVVLSQERGLIPQDYYRMTFVGDVQVSPSGNLVAFTVTTILEDENERHREIWLQRLDNGQPLGEPFRFTDPTSPHPVARPITSTGSTRRQCGRPTDNGSPSPAPRRMMTRMKMPNNGIVAKGGSRPTPSQTRSTRNGSMVVS